MGEKHVRRLNAAGTARLVFGTADDRSVYSESNHPTARRFAGLGANGVKYAISIWTDANSMQGVDNQTFGSRHPSVCQFVLCDGSVRAIPPNIDLKILTRLANRHDGEPIGDF
jgi:hypothetical protein